MNSAIIRAAIIGCGKIGESKYMNNLSKIPEVELAAFCDVDEDKAMKALKNFGSANSKHYTDYRKVLEDNSIDVVHVCTPHGSHAEISIDSLEAGKHVMCEKPMASTVEQAKNMVEAAKRTGKKLSIGLQHRFKPEAQYLYKACREGLLGDIYYARAIYLRRRGIPSYGAFIDKKQSGGGALLDGGSHALDMTLWLLDNYEVKSVTGTTYNKMGKKKLKFNNHGPWNTEEFTVEDTALAFIVLKNGATVTLEASWAMNTLQTGHALTMICGTDGGADTLNGLTINMEGEDKLIDYKPDLQKDDGSVFSPEDNMFTRQVKQWIDCVVNDSEPLVKPEQVLVVSEVLEAIYKSAETGKTIYF